MTEIPGFLETITQLSVGELLVAGTIGIVIALAGIFALMKIIKEKYNALSVEHRELGGDLDLKYEKMEEFLDRKHEKLENQLNHNQERLKDTCDNIREQMHGFCKVQELQAMKEKQALEVNVDLNSFIQSANAMATQNMNFTLEKQTLEDSIANLQKEFESERESLRRNFHKELEQERKIRERISNQLEIEKQALAEAKVEIASLKKKIRKSRDEREDR